MKVKLCILVGLWAVFAPGPGFAETIYVNSICGNDLWTGQSSACDALEPTGPMATIGEAIRNAAPGDTISVADGIYRYTETYLHGYVTVKSENGPEACIINCGNYAPAFICNFDSNTIDGFTIMNGYASNGGAIQCKGPGITLITNCIFNNCRAESRGGAFYISEFSRLNIQHCTFNNCSASEGGAICAEDRSSLTIDLCTFENNTGDFSGGAISLYNASATILDTDFDNNTTPQEYSPDGRGGAITASNSILYLSYCNFNNNLSTQAGGALYGIDQSVVSLSNCAFSGNRLTDDYPPEGGGAICVVDSAITAMKSIFNNNYAGCGGAIAVSGPKANAFTDCAFNSNIADQEGGAIFCMGSLSLENCSLKYNHADNGPGAALVVEKGNLHLSGCDISGNIAQWNSIAIAGPSNVTITNSLITGNRSTEFGGAIGAYKSSLSLINVTIADNAPVDMPVISVSEIQTPVTLKNVILLNQSYPPIDAFNNPEPMITYTNFYNENTPLESITPGIGNLSENPLIVQPGHFADTGVIGDDRDDTWVEGDYRLKSQAGHWDTASQTWIYDDVSSPCIDRADPLDAVKDEPFPNGDRRNMGAYGASKQASKSPVCTGPIPGDTNNDCKVDFADFAAVAAHWMECNMIPQSLCW